MGLFLYLAGPVSTAEPTASEQVLRCNGVNNQSYVCESGHCCEEDHCCSYFYEYWWFWLVWAIIVILICSCLFHHRRIKHRLQQQRRQHEINLIAYREAHIHSAPPFYHRFLPNSLLPAYDEVMGHPVTPPPPYNLNTGPPVCSSTDLQDVQCPSRQSTPVPTASVALCPSPCIEGFESSRGQEHKVHGADRTRDSVLKQDAIRTRPLRAAELPEEEKERILRRHRHFTGDSGIEVCLCDPGTESQEPKELEKLLGENSHERSMEFCERCSVGANGDEEEGERGAELGASLLNEPDPQTGNEQGGPRDPQS